MGNSIAGVRYTSWAEYARRRDEASWAAARRSMPSISVPYADSDYTAPGWLFLGLELSTIPHVAYPWDPAVLRAIREFCPDAVPLGLTYILRWGGYGQMDQPITVFRHGLGRAIPDLKIETAQFLCRTPSTPVPGCSHLPRPNYIENIWHDRAVREFGPDFPGAYIEFGWEYHASLREAYTDNKRPQDLADAIMRPELEQKAAVVASSKDDAAYVARDIAKTHVDDLSDVEWRDHVEGGAKVAEPKPSVVVPGAAAATSSSVN